MDTAQEALFKAMLNNGWFTQSSGNVEAPTGYFGWVHNHPSEVATIRSEFEDVIEAYGPIPDEQIVGVWWAKIDSQGFIQIEMLGNVHPKVGMIYDMKTNPAVKEAENRFDRWERDYNKWDNDEEDE